MADLGTGTKAEQTHKVTLKFIPIQAETIVEHKLMKGGGGDSGLLVLVVVSNPFPIDPRTSKDLGWNTM